MDNSPTGDQPQTPSDGVAAAADGSETAGGHPNGQEAVVVDEAAVVVVQKSCPRREWIAAASTRAGDDGEFSWIGVEAPPPRDSVSSADSSLCAVVDNDLVVEQVVQTVDRAPPRPPVVEELIQPEERRRSLCAFYESPAGIAMVPASPLASPPDSPPIVGFEPVEPPAPPPPVRDDDDGSSKVSVRRLDDMLANSRIDFELLDGNGGWPDSINEHVLNGFDVGVGIDSPPPSSPVAASPVPVPVMEDSIVPERRRTPPLVLPECTDELDLPPAAGQAETPQAKPPEVAIEPAASATVVPPQEATPTTPVQISAQVVVVDQRQAKAPASPPAAVEAASTGDAHVKVKAESGGVFGFFKRKQKNGSESTGHDGDDQQRIKKSNSLDKKAVAADKNAADTSGLSTPNSGNKEKNGSRFHFGFGTKDRKAERAAAAAAATSPTGDDDSDEDVDVGGGANRSPKRQPQRPNSAGGATKSPRKTNIRIFEIMASNQQQQQQQQQQAVADDVVTSSTLPPTSHSPLVQTSVDARTSSPAASVLCPVGPPVTPILSSGAKSAGDDKSSTVSSGRTTDVVDSSPSSPGGRSASGSQPSERNLLGSGPRSPAGTVDGVVDRSTVSQSGLPYMVAVAIDFGTTFSGYAFSFTHDASGQNDLRTGMGPSIHMMGKWEGGDPGVINQKTPSTLLLNPDGEFHSFGFTARNFYHDLTADDADRWLYFDKFKMSLYDVVDLNMETMIRAANGTQYPAFNAVTLTLYYFKEHALHELSEQCGTKIINDDVRWVITVPAIWNVQAKQFMRLAAYKAGIASSDKPDQLLIALEPEAASIHIRRLRMHQLVPDKPVRRPLSVRRENSEPPADLQSVSDKFSQRMTRYMVVDCGGGTVDITVHDLDTVTGRLHEMHKAAGGPHGSCGIDNEFGKLLGSMFGVEFMKSFQRRHPSGWICLMTAFESRKRAADPYRTTPLNVPLPFSFIDYFRKQTGSTVEAAINRYGDKEVRWSSQGMIRLSQDAMKRLFQSTLDSIGQTVSAVLEHPRLKDVQYIFLVGGLSESPVLQHDMRQKFGAQAQVLVPQEASLAVLKGAVSFGIDSTIVTSRRSRMTYGAAVLKRFVRGQHQESKLLRRPNGDWCRDVFDPYVVADQAVRVGDVVTRRYAPAGPGQTFISIGVFCSPDPAPVFTTDQGVSKCATVRLDFAGISQQQQQQQQKGTRIIETRMTFAETEIKVTAIDVSTGQAVDASIDFFKV